MSPVREIQSRHRAFHTIEGDGVDVLRAVPGQGYESVGPFIFLDHFGPIPFDPASAKGASAHPHAGIETLTLLIEGRMRHKDSLGNASTMSPGDVQWMRAGRGIVHDEQPDIAAMAPGERTHGVQLWINLPAGSKHIDPAYRHVGAGDIPLLPSEGGATRARLVAGQVGSVTGPVETFGAPLALHVSFDADDSLVVPTASQELGVYVMLGSALVGVDARPVEKGELARLTSGQAVVLSATAGTELLVLGGDRLDSAILRHGPFVMNSVEELQRAVGDYQSGRMGMISNP